MKILLLKVLFALRTFLDAVFRFREISILCYHSISNDGADTAVAPGMFETHLAALKKAGYTFVPLSGVIAWYDGEGENVPLPRKAVALTFDDGYADFKTAALPILETYNAPAMLFVVGDRDAYRTRFAAAPPMLTDVEVAGLTAHSLIEIGWHTKTHPHLSQLPERKVVEECAPPTPMRFFAYPGGNYSDRAIRAVQDAGFSAAFSIKRDLVRRGKSRWLLPRIVVLKHDTARDVVRYASAAQHWYMRVRSMIQAHA